MWLVGLVLLGVSWVSPADAACSGSGTTWSCTAGTTPAQVSSTLSSASNNATLTFAAGSYSWTSDVAFLNGKGVTLICASVGGCTVTGGGLVGMNGTCSGTTTDLIRVSGFAFSGSGTRFWFYGPSACTVTKIRIDHNTFTGSGSDATIMYFGENSSVNNFFYGVADHNTITAANSVYFGQHINSFNNTPAAGSLGSSSNFFYEDNTATLTAMTNTGTGFVDGWGGHGVVVRFNTIQNTRILMHGTEHAWGPINFEVYYNTVRHNAGSALPTGYRSVHHQGSGMMMAFENLIAQASGQSHDSEPMAVLHSGAGDPRSGGNGVCDGTSSNDENRAPTATYHGYACKRGPGRDSNALLYPMYAWRNRWEDDGSRITLDCDNAYASFTCTAHIVTDRDLFNAVSINAQSSPTSPFNGTTGMGHGTLANRPTTCTTTSSAPEAGRSGVGYWATDGGRNWRTDNGSGNDGGLYVCTATNTWTLWYTPYDYPHPLVSGTTDTTPPAAPTGVTIQ